MKLRRIILDIFMILASVALGMVLGSSAGGLGLGVSPGWRPTGEPEGLIGSGSKTQSPGMDSELSGTDSGCGEKCGVAEGSCGNKVSQKWPTSSGYPGDHGIETPSDHRKPAVDSRGPAVSGDKRE